MIEKYGLFDSYEGDERVYAEADLAALVMSVALDGVHGAKTALQVTPAPSGLAVNVAAGHAIVQGRYYALIDDGGERKTLALSAAHSKPRIDRIILRLDYALRAVSLGVLEGEAADAPSAPALVRDSTQYMLSLAQVRVETGAALLDETSIMDERPYDLYCGIHTESADRALNAANAAQQRADKGVADAGDAMEEAKRRVLTVNGNKPDDAGNAAVKVGVAGAQEGHVALFDQEGNLVSSGESFWAFHHPVMILEGTTLHITVSNY